jgi:hypothetical protein
VHRLRPFLIDFIGAHINHFAHRIIRGKIALDFVNLRTIRWYHMPYARPKACYLTHLRPAGDTSAAAKRASTALSEGNQAVIHTKMMQYLREYMAVGGYPPW